MLIMQLRNFMLMCSLYNCLYAMQFQAKQSYYPHVSGSMLNAET